jgi:hypothetical protein
MSNTAARGWWWCDSSHSNSQGAMSLTTEGKAVIATSLSIGEGESITSPYSTPLTVVSKNSDTGTAGRALAQFVNETSQDLSQQKTFVDFVFKDTNTNEIPQVRIGAELGPNSDANTQEKEGEGAFVVYTNNATGTGPTPTGLAERMRVDYRGYLGLGDSTPSYQIDVNGTIRATGDVIAYSDRRVKDNIETIENGLEKVTKLRGVSYTRNDIEDDTTKIGVIAQEVLEVLPEVVKQDDRGKYSVSYGNMAGLFIEAIKELKAEIEELKKQIK